MNLHKNVKPLIPDKVKNPFPPKEPKIDANDPVPNRTWTNQVVYYAVQYADDIEKVGDKVVKYSATLDGRLKWIGQALGYAIKYAGGYIDKKIMRAEDINAKN